DDWDRLKIMIDILRPIFDATEILSTSTYPTISDVRLTIFGLIQESYPDDENYLFVESINSKLREYWDYIEESTTISTLLDPRSKTKTFKTTEQHEKAMNMLQNQIKNYTSNQQNRVVSNIKKNKRLFFESLLTEQSGGPSIEDEVTRYITTSVICILKIL
ncbi:28758_t:CDS:2, partial [Dentiscutata erythropus]